MLASYRQALKPIPDVPGAARVATQRYRIRHGETAELKELAVGETFVDFTVPLDTDCQVALCYADAAGNEGPEVTFDFRSPPATPDPLPTPEPLDAPQFMGTVE